MYPYNFTLIRVQDYNIGVEQNAKKGKLELYGLLEFKEWYVISLYPPNLDSKGKYYQHTFRDEATTEA